MHKIKFHSQYARELNDFQRRFKHQCVSDDTNVYTEVWNSQKICWVKKAFLFLDVI